MQKQELINNLWGLKFVKVGEPYLRKRVQIINITLDTKLWKGLYSKEL